MSKQKTNDELVIFPELTKITKETMIALMSLFPNYIETYDNWVRFEFICIPVHMISFDWKKKLKELGIDALKQEFIKRGYDLKRRVQTLDFDDGKRKKIKIIAWEVNKKIY